RARFRGGSLRLGADRLVRPAVAGRTTIRDGAGVAAADDARCAERQTDSGSRGVGDVKSNRPLIIVNPAAGDGRARGFWERCAACCASAGLDLEVIETHRRGDAADSAAAAGDRLVVSVGGDGTAHEVVNGLLRRPAGTPPRFAALLRGGTAGDLAKSVPSPSRPEQVPAWLATDRWRRLDAGMWIAPKARTDDGLFEVVTIGDVGRVLGIRSLPMLYRGTHGRLKQVEFAQGRRVEIDSDEPIGVEADGELAGSTPAVFEI